MRENGNLALVAFVGIGAIAVKVTDYVRVANLAMYKKYLLITLCGLAMIKIVGGLATGFLHVLHQ
jgi:hypothetical protein